MPRATCDACDLQAIERVAQCSEVRETVSPWPSAPSSLPPHECSRPRSSTTIGGLCHTQCGVRQCHQPRDSLGSSGVSQPRGRPDAMCRVGHPHCAPCPQLAARRERQDMRAAGHLSCGCRRSSQRRGVIAVDRRRCQEPHLHPCPRRKPCPLYRARAFVENHTRRRRALLTGSTLALGGCVWRSRQSRAAQSS